MHCAVDRDSRIWRLLRKNHLEYKQSGGYTYRPIVISYVREFLTKSKPYKREWKNKNNREQEGQDVRQWI